MAVYAGRTKLPQGDISDILEGGKYFGPSRLIAPAIGSGTGLGLGALFAKTFDVVKGGKADDKKKKKKKKKRKYKILNPNYEPGGDESLYKEVDYKPKTYKNKDEYDRAEAKGEVREGDSWHDESLEIKFSPQDVRFFELAEKYRHLSFPEFKEKMNEEMKKPFLVKDKNKYNKGGLVSINNLTRPLGI